ncbi:MAG TPA: 16S rRNA (cytosine(1402)-N(4))-methyltransferase RsmH [Polyangiaceae bacterium]|nr:16S rRNA (cytosine(1402)-N(4))-methyltransferase RsmH [Polyangiaceae bacterium]
MVATTEQRARGAEAADAPKGEAAAEAPGAFAHVTVMGREVVEAIAATPGRLVVDATAGGGGHSEALLEAVPGARLVALDRDPSAVEAARARLARFGARALVVQANFADVERALASLGLGPADGLVADFGVSSAQLDTPGRGMSFRHEGPLDMRMDPTSGETARELIARLPVDELADVIFHYGDERRSRRIARCVKRASDEGELATTLDLRRAVVRAVGPARVGGVDPATRTFQALRIAVNGELDAVSALLAAAPRVLAPGGVAAFLSFHSLEDRLVKRALADRATWEPLSKKPLTARDDELAQNPRSRSAKLRLARRREGGAA